MRLNICALAFVTVLLLVTHGYAAVFDVPSGNVTALISAINRANRNGEKNTINLEPGTYTITAPYGQLDGLPITGKIVIQGADAATTVIERDPAAPHFRVLRVESRGSLTIKRLTIRNGRQGDGAGILNFAS